MTSPKEILEQKQKPALLIGNGVNRFKGDQSRSWDALLDQLGKKYGLNVTPEQMSAMSNTEFFDLLDLAKPDAKKGELQKDFCKGMQNWGPAAQHKLITDWARRHSRPILTVNFDENLSRAANAKYFAEGKKAFTATYPWRSYFADEPMEDPRTQFAIWHPHGMMRYPLSVQLGLTQYMGSVKRAYGWVKSDKGCLEEVQRIAKDPSYDSWKGRDSWLDILFFSPLMIFGFGFGKDETFLRWLFLERARFHKRAPQLKNDVWFVDTPKPGDMHRAVYFEGLGIHYVPVTDFADIYANPAWKT